MWLLMEEKITEEDENKDLDLCEEATSERLR